MDKHHTSFSPPTPSPPPHHHHSVFLILNTAQPHCRTTSNAYRAGLAAAITAADWLGLTFSMSLLASSFASISCFSSLLSLLPCEPPPPPSPPSLPSSSPPPPSAPPSTSPQCSCRILIVVRTHWPSSPQGCLALMTCLHIHSPTRTRVQAEMRTRVLLFHGDELR